MEINLFDIEREKELKKKAPLAERNRPQSLEDYFGQEHVLGKDKQLYRLIKANMVSSMILYGPPGTGKTSLARIIANSCKQNFEQLSAVTSGVKEIRETIEKAKMSLEIEGKSTILFIDEIHRFNKSQQDALLPHVESGLIVLIGATTENPFFSVNKALLSRTRIIELKALAKTDIIKIIDKALSEDKILSKLDIEFEEGAKNYLAHLANNDARVALNTLELAVLSSDQIDGKIIIDKKAIEESIAKKILNYDKDGDDHYNTISAFIKSIRGSDPDAAIYYLALMLYSGEDPLFISRRLMISASEDIGLANPNAMQLASSCHQIVQNIGMPEARISLAETTIYLALSPKSNSSYLAIDKALAYIKNGGGGKVPAYLKDSHYDGAEFFKEGETYKYPHDYFNSYVNQRYLPEDVDELFYQAKTLGIEEDLNKFMEDIKNKK